jgi:hypothetical protein
MSTHSYTAHILAEFDGGMEHVCRAYQELDRTLEYRLLSKWLPVPCQ